MRKAATRLAVLLMAFAACAAQASAAQNHKRPTARTAANRSAPPLPVTGASLMVAGSATPLWSLHGESRLPIASTTKMMTALVVLQHVTNLNTVFTQTDWRADSVDSQIDLAPGERMTVHDLLLALLLPSADDAAEDLAYNVGRGSVTRFVGWMNADAHALGLDHTHYTTPIGLDTPGNYSSPDDLVRLAGYLMHNWPFFRHSVGLSSATLTSGRYVRHVVSTDDLVGKVPWIRGVKTGHTAAAGYVLVSEGQRDGFTLLASVLGTTSEDERDASALHLLDWGFSEFRVVRPVRAGQLLVRRRVPYEIAPARVVAARGYRTVVARGTRVSVVVGKLRKLSGPMAKGTVVGELRVNVAGRQSAQVPLILARRLPAVSEMTKLGHLVRRPFTLLMLALLLGGGVAAVRIGRRRRPRVLLTRPVDER
jgi:D-alanyl-D-alanine carboxypeptidase (penicillin-binding protein 5/6)